MANNCEQCTCGRHKRPHAPHGIIGKDDPAYKTTEYTNKYQQHPLEAQKNFRPEYEPLPQAEFHDATTHRADYTPKKGERPFVREPEQYQGPRGEFTDTTSYNKEYYKKQVPPAQPIRHDGPKLDSGKFEANPTYRADYKPWELSRQQAYGPRDSYQAPQIEFGGESTMKHDYIKYGQAKRDALRPREAAIHSDVPLDDRTRYRDDYVKHPLQQRYQHHREEYRPSSKPLEGITTFQRDYKGQQGEPTRSCRPNNEAYSSGAPMDDKTTHRVDYTPKAMERPYVHRPEEYHRPDGEFNDRTSYNDNYKQMPLQKSVAVRPTSANKAVGAPFDGKSMYTQNYKKWPLQRIQPVTREEYHANPQPFVGMPTYKAHYTGHNVAPAQSMRPDNTAYQSNARFEDGTMYRNAYTPKQRAPCPCDDPNIPPNRVIVCQKHNVPVMSTITRLDQDTRRPIAVA